MLSHSLQQQVVDGREMIVAAALQRLVEGKTKIDDFATNTSRKLLPSVPISGHLDHVWYSRQPCAGQS